QFWPRSEPLILRAEVEQEFGFVQAGQAAEVEDYYDSTAFKGKGKVKRVSQWFTQRRTVLDDPMQFKDVRTLECIIEDLKGNTPEDDKRGLRIGQRLKVRIARP